MKKSYIDELHGYDCSYAALPLKNIIFYQAHPTQLLVLVTYILKPTAIGKLDSQTVAFRNKRVVATHAHKMNQ